MKKRFIYRVLVGIACVLTFCHLVVTVLPAQAEQEASAPQEDRDTITSFAYTITNPAGPNAIEAFRRHPQTGRLTRIGRFPTGGTGDPFVGGFQQHAIVSNGRFLYAVNPGSDTISAFAIAVNGRLRLLGSVPSNGRRPVSLALHDRLLYVANEGSIPGDASGVASYSGFHIRHDGSLRPIPNSTVLVSLGGSLADVLFNASGEFLVGMRFSGQHY